MIPKKAQEILDFWFKETSSEKKFKKDEAFDQTIRNRFLNDYELASQNEYDDWQDQPMSTLALVILFDQFSRNMFRDNKKAFSQDHKTRLIVNDAVYAGYLETMNESHRFFMILPLIHSEEITDHDMAYYLLNKYLREHEEYNQIKKFWQDHTKAIRLFHRYPHRNKVLGRDSTLEEKEFLKDPNSSW
ncbi:DUF924 domain-containing protein [Pelagibacterales bacterium SAG-MED46]|nr:DUF924 domain-containing protein [Pelagibacterales bacterium SAG-MED46]